MITYNLKKIKIRLIYIFKLNGYSTAAKQIDDGMKSAGHLFNAMDGMFKLQIKLAKEYEKYANTHETKISKMTEYDPVKQVILDHIKIARCNAGHHRYLKLILPY
jgi:hypothetical protein